MRRPEIPLQAIAKRIKNFLEVSLGFSKKQAIEEAKRCPQCSHPTCIAGCPLGIDIPGFIRNLREGDFGHALRRIREQNSLAGVCGRICSAPCEKVCILNKEKGVAPISIKALERFAWDYGRSKFQRLFNAESSNQTQKKIAVIGSGPAGLMVAADLVEDGHAVTVFEAFHVPGGSLQHGTCELRLPKKVIGEEADYVRSLGVEIKINTFIGQTFQMEDLRTQGFEAVVLATGAGIPILSTMPGNELKGVFYASDIILRVNLAGEENLFVGHNKVVILGADQKTLDCARVLVRLGKEVHIFFAGTEEEILVSSDEITQAKEEGVTLDILTKPLELLPDDKGHVKQVKCIKVDFADTGEEGKWQLVAVKDSEFVVEANCVVLSCKEKANNLLSRSIEGFKINKDGSFFTKKNQSKTSVDNVFVVGQAKDSDLMFIDILEDAQKASKEIDLFVRGENK